MHYNGTKINTNIQYQYLHAHDSLIILPHIEILLARLLIILHMARYSQTFIFSLFSYLSKVNTKKVQNKTALDSFNSSIIKT